MAKTLRPYQEKIHNATKAFIENDEMLGQIYAPTGAGKTVLFNKALEHAVELGMRNFCVVTPRIALSQQQVRNGAEWICGIEVMKNSFNSGAHTGDPDKFEINTTDVTAIQECINWALDKGKIHITYSSYASFHKINSYDFDLVIFDESQYLARKSHKDYTQNLGVNTKAILYTATPVAYTDEYAEVDMLSAMNEEWYGKVLAEVLPLELYRGGYIVPPAAIKLYAERREDYSVPDIVDMAVASFVTAYREMKKLGMPYTQMLICARNAHTDIPLIQKDVNMIMIYERVVKQLPEIAQHFDINAITASMHTTNGRNAASRAALLDDIEKNQTNCILVHYDTIAEGIDISTISAVLILRELEKEKLIQTVGRCSRPFKGDLFDGSPDSSKYSYENGFDIRKKRFSIVILPVVDGIDLAGYEVESTLDTLAQAAEYKDILTVKTVVMAAKRNEVEPGEPEDVQQTRLKNARSAALHRFLRAACNNA